MKVKLKRNYYAPNGKLYRSVDGIQDIPTEFCEKLPKDAEIIDEKAIAKAKAEAEAKAEAAAKAEAKLEAKTMAEAKADAKKADAKKGGAKKDEDKSAEVDKILGQ